MKDVLVLIEHSFFGINNFYLTGRKRRFKKEALTKNNIGVDFQTAGLFTNR